MPPRIRAKVFIALALVIAVGAVSCADSASSGPTLPDAGPPSDASTTAGDDLPCEVRDLLTTRCVTCHSDPPRTHVARPMVTRSQLLARSMANPALTVAQLAVRRMRSSTDPMPPGGGVPEETIAAFERWVTAGGPAGACANPVADPFSAPETCTSDHQWTRGNHGDRSMNPGQACIQCHTDMAPSDGPIYSLAGTVYPSGHEPDNCYGASTSPDGPISIEVTDATGRVIRMVPTASGNFFSTVRITTPYRARVLVGNRERRMNTAQDDGDCNVCHTQMGLDDVPGRIVLP